jgi:hypothetical protein
MPVSQHQLTMHKQALLKHTALLCGTQTLCENCTPWL